MGPIEGGRSSPRSRGDRNDRNKIDQENLDIIRPPAYPSQGRTHSFGCRNHTNQVSSLLSSNHRL